MDRINQMIERHEFDLVLSRNLPLQHFTVLTWFWETQFKFGKSLLNWRKEMMIFDETPLGTYMDMTEEYVVATKRNLELPDELFFLRRYFPHEIPLK